MAGIFNRKRDKEKPNTSSNLSASWVISLLIGGFVVIAAALMGVIAVLSSNDILRPEFTLPLLVIGSVTVLMVGLAATAIVFRRLGLDNPGEAMGLPEGSIRAIIALMLIMIFAVVSVFLISNADTNDRRVITGISGVEADKYSSSEIISRELISGDPSDADSAVYEVVLTAGDRASAEMAQQLMTTLGTLVVAIAAFYFGSQSVAAAQQRTVNPNSRVPSPTAPVPDPNAPVPDPNAPVPDPNAPVPAPNAPVPDPNAPGPDPQPVPDQRHKLPPAGGPVVDPMQEAPGEGQSPR
ncbi:hypothetical protein [Microbacterium gallinarum]|uniref:Uncharacterized protein n=1 Tax=Microbacterium gallinarum TaxID=2762209 RepID=A0ABR8X719_9MICO|nr:hypothetical protein [Microbacterium gallinarum]MBD8024591.1 hypothetical protein [Microbacterium gallinarum]